MDEEKKKDDDFLKDLKGLPGMSFEEFQAGPGKIVDKLAKDMQSQAGPAERMARSIQAMSDAAGFEALVSLCMELIWLRKQISVIPKMGREAGPKAGMLFAELAHCTWRTLGACVPNIDVDEVLKKKDKEEET